MSTKPLTLLLHQVRARPEHRALVERVRAHASGCAPEAVGIVYRPAGGNGAGAPGVGSLSLWSLAFWTSVGESGEALCALRGLESAGHDVLAIPGHAKRLLALLDVEEAHRRRRGEREDAQMRVNTRAWAAKLAQAAYGIGVAGPVGNAPRAPRPFASAVGSIAEVSPLRREEPVDLGDEHGADAYVLSPLGDGFDRHDARATGAAGAPSPLPEWRDKPAPARRAPREAPRNRETVMPPAGAGAHRLLRGRHPSAIRPQDARAYRRPGPFGVAIGTLYVPWAGLPGRPTSRGGSPS